MVRPRRGIDELKVMKIVEFDNDYDYRDIATPLLLQQQRPSMLILFFLSFLSFYSLVFFLDLLPFFNLTNKGVGGFFFGLGYRITNVKGFGLKGRWSWRWFLRMGKGKGFGSWG